MKNPVLKKTIFISLLGHITVFSIFGFSFGNRIPTVEYASVSFWGQFLHNSQVSQPITTGLGLRKSVSRYYLNAVRDNTDSNNHTMVSNGTNTVLYNAVKPPFTLAFNREKEAFTPLETMWSQEENKMSLTGFIEKFKPPLLSSRRQEPTIIFHPLLPYGFTLYFKDRQVAHVELMFKMLPIGTGNSILIKRKISSGNLEVDLLTLRYIGHYLFIHKTCLFPNNWQTVKIDLSAKNDK